MSLTTLKVVGLIRAKLREVEAQIKALEVERALLTNANAALHRGAKRKVKLKELTKGKKKGLSAASRKRISAARKKAWAKVKKHGLKDLADLKAYKAKHAKAAA
jgi:hypothetical protein